MNHRAAGFQVSFCNGVIQFAMQAELKMTQWDQHLAMFTEKVVQYSCTVSSAGGRQKIALWDSQCEHIDSFALGHSWLLAVAKRMRTVGSTGWFVGKVVLKCSSIGNEVPSLYTQARISEFQEDRWKINSDNLALNV